MSVSLKIKGNKFSNEGLGIDLVAIGDPAFTVLDQQYPGAGTSAFIVVRHTPGKSIYTLVSTNVTSSDGQRDGTMMVAVAIPTGQQVDGLYNMLVALTETYKQLYMTPVGNRFRFLPTRETPDAFAAILAQHRVSRMPYRPVETKGDINLPAYLYLTPAQISQLLDDPMRNEFAPYGQIVLVPVVNPEAYQSTFPISPVYHRTYKIIVNGRMTTQTVSDPDKTITIGLGATATHLPAQISFTLSQAHTGIADVSVDDFNQTISVRLVAKVRPPKPKPQPTVEEPQRDKKHIPLWAWIVSAIAVVGVIAAAAWIILSGGDSNNTEQQPMPPAAPTEQTDSLKPSEDDADDEVIDDSTQPIDDSKEASADKLRDKYNKDRVSERTNAEDVNNKNAKDAEDTNVGNTPAPKGKLAEYTKLLQSTDLTYVQLNEIENYIHSNPDNLAKKDRDKLSDLYQSNRNLINIITKAETVCSNADYIKSLQNVVKTLNGSVKTYIKNLISLGDTEALTNVRLAIQKANKTRRGKIYVQR
jgi:hypothetical protein